MAAWYDAQSGDERPRVSVRDRLKAWVASGEGEAPPFEEAAMERVIRGMRDTPFASKHEVGDDGDGED